MDKIKVTTPITHDGVIISTFRKEKIRPTANESIARQPTINKTDGKFMIWLFVKVLLFITFPAFCFTSFAFYHFVIY